MGKLIFILLAAVIVYLLLRTRRSPAREDDTTKRPASPEAMVECAHCGLHVPLGESLEFAGRRYCCEDHRRLGGGR